MYQVGGVPHPGEFSVNLQEEPEGWMIVDGVLAGTTLLRRASGFEILVYGFLLLLQSPERR